MTLLIAVPALGVGFFRLLKYSTSDGPNSVFMIGFGLTKGLAMSICQNLNIVVVDQRNAKCLAHASLLEHSSMAVKTYFILMFRTPSILKNLLDWC